jgi:hypothetical protein
MRSEASGPQRGERDGSVIPPGAEPITTVSEGRAIGREKISVPLPADEAATTQRAAAARQSVSPRTTASLWRRRGPVTAPRA